MMFDQVYNSALGMLLEADKVDRGEWHAQDVSNMPALVSHEVRHLTFELYVPETVEELREQYQPNVDWADEHFLERVSGKPLNPPPSHERWPFGNTAMHQKDKKFSHTYPERYWPKTAGAMGASPGGIRYRPGDLNDLINLLSERPMTRQAYLPVWFPEDLTAALQHERCPCSIGYHFLRANSQLHIEYQLRSCDFVRHFRDDMYLTARLLLWVLDKVKYNNPAKWGGVMPGDLVVHIGSLHCMTGDLKQMEAEYETL